MKILLIAIAVAVILIAGIVVIGLLLPKRHVVSRSASYRATPDGLFTLIAGPQNWRPDVRGYEPVADPNGHDLVRETTKDGETITYELLDRVPPRSIKRRIATPNLPYAGTWTFSLEPKGETTLVRITEDGEVYNPLFRFVSRFILGQTGTIDRYLQALATATGQQIEIGN
jgi:hypothetical protein